MATKQDLVDGLSLLTREANRIAGRFTDEEWKLPGDEGGWTTKQAFAHVAGVGSVSVVFVTSLLGAGRGSDAGAALDIDAVNAQLVAQRSDKSVGELVAEFERGYGALSEWVTQQPDSVLEERRTLGGYADMTIADLIMQTLVMHGVSHLYHSASRFP